MKPEAEGSKTAWIPKRELDYQYKHCGDNNAAYSYETMHRNFFKSVHRPDGLLWKSIQSFSKSIIYHRSFPGNPQDFVGRACFQKPKPVTFPGCI